LGQPRHGSLPTCHITLHQRPFLGETELPDILLRLVPTGQDVPFVVNVKGIEPYFDQLQGFKYLEILITEGQSELEIIGLWMMPDFPGVILAMVFGFLLM
jgi:hypothetical protein